MDTVKVTKVPSSFAMTFFSYFTFIINVLIFLLILYLLRKLIKFLFKKN